MAATQPSDFTLSYSAYIAEKALQAPRAKNVASQHINKYGKTGASGSLQLSRFDDIGRADSVPAGTEYQTEAEFGSTATTLTPTRRAKMGLVDKDTMLQRVPEKRVDEIFNVVQFGGNELTPEGINELVGVMADAMGQETADVLHAHYKTVEYDTVQLLDGFTNNAGTSGSAATVANHEECLFNIENAEDIPHSDIVCCYDIQQFYNIKADIRANGNATPFTPDLATILKHRPNLGLRNFRGELLGSPIFTLSRSMRLTANGGADVVGAAFLRGEGQPELMGGEGQAGAFAFVQKHGPHIVLRYIPRAFSIEIIVDWPWIVGERVDAWGSSLTTDAPS